MAVASSASPQRAGLFGRLFSAPGRGWLTLPVICFLLAVFVFPLVLIGLYSVNLLTNLFGVPTNFSLVNWESFLPPGDNVFWDRFKTSMVITLLVSVLAVVAAYPLAYFLAFVAQEAALHAPAAHPRALLHELPAARDRVEGDPRQQRRHQLGPLAARPARPGGRDHVAHLLVVRGRARPLLLLGAVRRAADLRRPREPGHAAPRGGAGPGGRTIADLLARDAAPQPPRA